MTPAWLTLDGDDHRPLLLSWPGGAGAWEGPSGPIRWRCGWVWAQVADQVVVVSLPADERAPDAAGNEDVWVLHNRTRSLRLTRDSLDIADRSVRHGGVLDLHRRAHRWTLEGERLPEGPAAAREIAPFPVGGGLVWQADGWLYRRHGARVARAIGRAHPHLTVGPRGALLQGDEGWEIGAPPHGDPVELPVALSRDVPLSWSCDGCYVTGGTLDEPDVYVQIDLEAGTWSDGAAPDDEPFPDPLLRGCFLVGPDGGLFDLAQGRRLPCPHLHGRIVIPTSTDWWAVHHDGFAAPFRPGGRPEGTEHHLPRMRDDEAIFDGWSDGPDACVQSDRGRVWRLGTHGTQLLSSATERALTNDLDEVAPGLFSAVVGGRRWWVTDDGLVLREGSSGLPETLRAALTRP